MSWCVPSVFSSGSFTVLGLKFKSLIYFVLMRVCGTIRLPFYSLRVVIGFPSARDDLFPLESIAEGQSAFCVRLTSDLSRSHRPMRLPPAKRQAAVIPGLCNTF